jgi:hypothetical protein
MTKRLPDILFGILLAIILLLVLFCFVLRPKEKPTIKKPAYSIKVVEAKQIEQIDPQLFFHQTYNLKSGEIALEVGVLETVGNDTYYSRIATHSIGKLRVK